MRTLSAVLCLVLASAPLVHAAPVDDAVAKAHEFIDAFDKGDVKAAEATHEADAAIIDEIGGHQWHGPGAFQAWAAALTKDAQSGGLTDLKVTLGKTLRAQVDGDTAYEVLEATFSYKEHGVAMSEPAQMVFALRKEADGWKIAAWAWAGGTPHKA
ncbi:MAG TPA: nuclear transport factor 2 family protein [Caulobacteraceae bacterium]|nr:nuclear transport factor 2 family protein [Caulobacteraceae bacterium]